MLARCKRCEKITNVDRTSHVYTHAHSVAEMDDKPRLSCWYDEFESLRERKRAIRDKDAVVIFIYLTFWPLHSLAESADSDALLLELISSRHIAMD